MCYNQEFVITVIIITKFDCVCVRKNTSIDFMKAGKTAEKISSYPLKLNEQEIDLNENFVKSLFNRNFECEFLISKLC